MAWIEVFRTGRHTDAAGTTRYWGEEDLDFIEKQYNGQYPEHEAPLVLGHPETDSPAFGWISKLRRDGQRLWAEVRQIADGVADAVKAGRYRKVSIALYPDRLLRHVGLLGGTPPAVKGLTPVKFAGTEYAEITGELRMAEDNMDDKGGKPDKMAELTALAEQLSARVSALEKANEELGKANLELADQNDKLAADAEESKFSQALAALTAEGKILPAESAGLLEIHRTLFAAQKGMKFSQGEKTPCAKLADTLKARPVLVEPRQKPWATTGDAHQFSADNGRGVDALALVFMEKHPNTTYEAAVKAVLGGAK